jgi:transcriptional regulator with XRE-family HTH domain
MTFGETLKQLRTAAGKSRYRLAQYSGINEAYILRLERGERDNPSRNVVLMLGYALVESSDAVGIWDIDELLLSAGYAPLRRRGNIEAAAT